MKKITKLKLCDMSLLAVIVAMLASGLQLETVWLGMNFIWLHIAMGFIMFGLIGWHLSLHFGSRGWLKKLRAQKSPATRLLAVVALLTLLTAIAATVHMFIHWRHSTIGGWHGIIGYALIAIAAAHTLKRHKFLTF